MTHEEITAVYERMFGSFPSALNVDDEENTTVGSHSVWLEDSKWWIGRAWSHYSSESGWDGGCEKLDEHGGPFNSYQQALRAALTHEFKMRLEAADEELGELTMQEYEAVEEILES
jgi:hypothetical protein